jgi:glycoside/pentoside/hexuronide:cation symporter, GPH family
MKTISWRDKMLYASGSLAANIVFMTTNQWLMYMYVPPKGRPLVPLLVFSFIMGAGRLIDGIADPLVGHWSDMTKSRWGRRRPFMAVGTPLLVIAFFFLWLPPDPHVSTANTIFFIILVNIFFFLYTFVMIPMMAILPEMASGDRDRVSLSGAQAAFGMLGTIAAAVGSGILIERYGYRGMAVILGAVTFFFYVAAIAGIRETPHAASEEKISLFRAFSATFTNKDFLAFGVSIVFFWVGFTMLLQITPFFLTEVILRRKDEMWKLMSPFMGSFIVILPLIIYISGRVRKKTIYSLCMLALTILFPLLYKVGYIAGIPRMVQGIVFMSIVGITAFPVFILPNAMIGDIADHDEMRTGKRREAMYYGVYGFLQKFAMAISALMLGFLFHRYGFSAPHVLGIRLAGPVTGVCILLGLIVFQFGYHCDVLKKDPGTEK